MNQNIDNLKSRQNYLFMRCQEITDVCKSEVRAMTEDEQKEFDKKEEEIKQLKEQIEALQAELDAVKEEPENKPEDKPEEQPEEPENKPEEQPKEETEDEPQDEPEDEQKEQNEDVDPDNEEDDKNKEDKNINLRTMEAKFSLIKELRNAFEANKTINLAQLNAEHRAYTVASDGANLVQTDVFDIWGPMRAKNVLIAAGAQYYPGLRDNVQLPVMSGVTVAFAAETGAASDGTGSISKITLKPHRITAKIPVSLELLKQENVGFEAKLREDIINAISNKLEQVLLGAGHNVTGTPDGILYGKTASVITSFAGVTALEAAVETNNFTDGNKYIMSPSAKADLRGMAKASGSSAFVMENGTIDGTEVFSTSLVANKDIIYGDFSKVAIATWDNVDIDVVRDVASLAAGQVTIVVNAYVDGALVMPNAIAYGTTQVSNGN